MVQPTGPGAVVPLRAEDLPAATPLPAAPDAELDRHARLARALLDVPVALVTLVSRDEQVFPGAVGLPEPWQTRRSTPLTHSFCQYVVASEQPLVVADVRDDAVLAENLAVPDLGVAAYAGVPLRDAEGRVVGSVCAIDTAPRTWTEEELAGLADLAASCSAELQLRAALAVSQRAEQEAEAARRDAEVARRATEQARAHTQVLLGLSEAMAATRDLAEVAAIAAGVARTGLGASTAGVALVDRRHRRVRFLGTEPVALVSPRSSLDGGCVAGAVARSRRAALHEDLDAFVRDFPRDAAAAERAGVQALAHLPLVSAGELVGVLAIGWDAPRALAAEEREVVSALAGYTAQALERCLVLDTEREVARTLQEAMLTELPSPQHLRLSARYLPAASGHQVGGDWYDAFALPGGGTTLVIGDVAGHDTHAAATMGALRNMVRAVGWQGGGGPSQVLRAVDRAVAGLRMGAVATAVLARVDPAPPGAGPGAHRLTWSSAGHLPPALVHPDGAVEVLRTAPEILLGLRPEAPRTDHERLLEPGSTLLLYTDGLVERRGEALDAGLDRLAACLAVHAAPDPGDLLDGLLGDIVGTEPEDDVAVLAVRVCG